MKLSKRTNTLFTNLLESWLVSDTTINYFCFDLCGFAFLLDTVGSDEPLKSASTEESKESVKAVTQKVTSALAVSDLDELLSEMPSSKDFVKNLQKVVKADEHPDWEVPAVLKSLRSKARDASLDSDSEDTKVGKDDLFKDGGTGEEQKVIPVQELGKTMVL